MRKRVDQAEGGGTDKRETTEELLEELEEKLETAEIWLQIFCQFASEEPHNFR